MKSIRETAEEIAERHYPSRTLTQNAGLISDIEQALRNERERCARFAEQVRLPRGFQWGPDAMEQFNFGKERAAAAIREQAANPKYKP